MPLVSRHNTACRLAMLVSLLVIGCGYSARNLSLDEAGARQACEKSLKAWQEGKKPADLKPDIIVGDEDWDAGCSLVAFKVLPDETNDGTNLHIPVELTIKDPKGTEKKKEVVYTVGTSPVVTVIRK